MIEEKERQTDSLLNRFNLWRKDHISEKQFILLLSLVVGVFTAFVAILLKFLISLIHEFIYGNLTISKENYSLLIYPVIGILVSGLFIRYIIRDDIGHGVTKILYSLSKKNGRIKPHNMYSSVIASAITIGMGGSVGAESPIVLTGSAIGSNVGRMFKMEHRTLVLLVGCGAAGAIAGIFKAPIAGLVFVLEVLMFDLSMGSLLPLLVSSVTAATVSYIVTGTDSMFYFASSHGFDLSLIPLVLVLGVVCGLVSLYFSHTMNWLENFFGRLAKPWKKFVLGATILSILIFLFPSLFGEGYGTISTLLDVNEDSSSVMEGSFFYGGNLLLYLTLMVFAKVFASTATNAGGGCGGIFAPSLFLGCIAGFVFGELSLRFFPDANISVQNFALLGMAGLMSGVMHAPLTGVFLIAELTGGYSMFLPLMMVSILSFLTIRLFHSHSIYSMRLARKGELMTHDKDQAVLLLMNIDNLIETEFLTLKPEMNLGQLVNVIARSNRNLFPVLDDDGSLVGIVNMESIRNIMFRQELYNRFTVQRLMELPPARLSVNDSMEAVMNKFDETSAWNLPVEDENGRYMGFVSKSKIFNSYRNILLEISGE
jgi:CIC family chloride channel protein